MGSTHKDSPIPSYWLAYSDFPGWAPSAADKMLVSPSFTSLEDLLWPGMAGRVWTAHGSGTAQGHGTGQMLGKARSWGQASGGTWNLPSPSPNIDKCTYSPEACCVLQSVMFAD